MSKLKTGLWLQKLLAACAVLIVTSDTTSAVAQTSTTYTYDALGRLTGASSNNGDQVSYAYDAAGNRTQSTSFGQTSAGAASLTVAYNTAGSVALSPGGNYSSLTIAAQPAHGTASISGTTATYTPTSGYIGSDSFTYTANGPGGPSAPATVTVTVNRPPAPTANPASLTVPYNTAGNVGLSPSGVYSSLAVAAAPAHGTASISGTTATYSPTSGYHGSDSFTYTATGPGGTSAPATVSVTVNNTSAPTVGNVSLNTAYNTAGSAALSVSGTYSSLSVASGPSHGSASISGATATYTPTSGYYGGDSFTYIATGPGGTSSPATVSVTVTTPAAPTVGNTSLSATYNTAGSVGLSPSGVYSSLAVASGPAHGSASISGTTATYTPTSGYYGADSFTYTATGPGGTSSPATVTVSVGTPAAPTVGNTNLSVGYNSSGSAGLSPSGVYSSLAIATAPVHGSASISGTTATYSPTTNYYGADSFTYTATGPGGTSSPATVSVSVGTPAPPTVGNASLTVNYNTAGAVGLSPSGVYSSLAVSNGPAHGSVSISGTTATYTPSSTYSGADSFTYTASGPGGTSSPGTVSITVNAATPIVPGLSNTNWNWQQTVGQSANVDAPITASATGGAGGYSYAWQLVSGDSQQTAMSPSSASTIWTKSPAPAANNVIYTSTWRCKITDSAGTVAYTSNVTVTFEHDNND